MVNKTRNKVEQRLCYKLEKWKKAGTSDIMNNISKNVTLVKLVDSLGNVSHAVSVVEKCIYDSNYEKALLLNI